MAVKQYDDDDVGSGPILTEIPLIMDVLSIFVNDPAIIQIERSAAWIGGLTL